MLLLGEVILAEVSVVVVVVIFNDVYFFIIRHCYC